LTLVKSRIAWAGEGKQQRNMPRPKRNRRMHQPPILRGFKPFGAPPALNDAVNMLFEEYESLRLADYDNLTQEEAAKRMNVSRPTFTRIYDRARKKLQWRLLRTGQY